MISGLLWLWSNWSVCGATSKSARASGNDMSNGCADWMKSSCRTRPIKDLSRITSSPSFCETRLPQTRDAVREHLHGRGIQTSIHYPPVHRFSIYRNTGVSLPQTEAAADSEISLPMHGNLKTEEVDRVVDTLKEGIWAKSRK